MQKNDTIILTESLYLSRGMHKRVYFHPDDPSLCIKIPYITNDIDVKRELRYRNVLAQQNKVVSLIPNYYGAVNTNLGVGYVFERIQDFDGNTSICVREFLKNYASIYNDTIVLENILLDFKKKYYQELPITSDIDPGNLMVQKTIEGYTIRIFDNIGSPVLIPLEYYSNYFAKSKIERYWNRFILWIKRENDALITDTLLNKLK